MVSFRNRLTIGICVALTGLLFAASLAKAEVGAFWLVSGSKISSALLPTVEAQTDVEMSLLTELGGKQIHIKCKSILFKEAHLVEPLGQALGKFAFHGCRFLFLGPGGELVESKTCEPHAEGSAGLWIWFRFIALIKLHEGKATLEVKPAEGGLLSTIELGEECAFGEKITLSGTLFLEDCQGEFLTDKVTHLFQEVKP